MPRWPLRDLLLHLDLTSLLSCHSEALKLAKCREVRYFGNQIGPLIELAGPSAAYHWAKNSICVERGGARNCRCKVFRILVPELWKPQQKRMAFSAGLQQHPA
jgi:hypothetical protein